MMKIITYNKATEYLEDNLRYLEREEAVNSLLIGISMSQKNLKNDRTLYLSVKDQGELQFTAIKTPGRNLLVYGNESTLDKFAAILIDYLSHEKIEIPGIIGPRELVLKLADCWKEKNRADYEIRFNQLIYTLDEIKYLPELAGQLKIARMEDLSLISKWFHLFMMEALNQDDEAAAHKMALKKIKEEEIYIWFNQVELAMTSIARPTNNGITINYVYTPLSKRTNGYGTKLVAELSKRMLAKGYKFCTLFTNLDNPTSNSIYKKIGYEPIKRFISIAFITNADT